MMAPPLAFAIGAPGLEGAPPRGAQPLPRRCRAWRARAIAAAATEAAPPPQPLTSSPAVVVVGGSGRVGSSAASALLQALPSARVALASRSQQSYEAAVGRSPALRGAKHVPCDVDQPSSLAAALRGADLVIHAAGPFQRRSDCSVLEAAIAAGVPYLDV